MWWSFWKSWCGSAVGEVGEWHRSPIAWQWRRKKIIRQIFRGVDKRITRLQDVSRSFNSTYGHSYWAHSTTFWSRSAFVLGPIVRNVEFHRATFSFTFRRQSSCGYFLVSTRHQLTDALQQNIFDIWQSLLLVQGQLTESHQHLTTSPSQTTRIVLIVTQISLPRETSQAQARYLETISQLWAVMKNVFTQAWLPSPAERILASLLKKRFDLSNETVKNYWSQLCAELISVGVPTLLHVLHTKTLSQSEEEMEVTRGLWAVLAKNAGGKSHTTEDGSGDAPEEHWMNLVQLLVMPFGLVDHSYIAWLFSHVVQCLEHGVFWGGDLENDSFEVSWGGCEGFPTKSCSDFGCAWHLRRVKIVSVWRLRSNFQVLLTNYLQPEKRAMCAGRLALTFGQFPVYKCHSQTSLYYRFCATNFIFLLCRTQDMGSGVSSSDCGFDFSSRGFRDYSDYRRYAKRFMQMDSRRGFRPYRLWTSWCGRSPNIREICLTISLDKYCLWQVPRTTIFDWTVARSPLCPRKFLIFRIRTRSNWWVAFVWEILAFDISSK